ncbi:MAG: hypothetical protein VYA72_04295 [Bacteroidota bacterium]|nr:hypothetical protein [Bacteroidota bacterium]
MTIRCTAFILSLGWFAMGEALAQTNTAATQEGWWQDLFRADSATKARTGSDLRPVGHLDLPPADVTLVMPDTLKVLDSLDKTNPRPVQGHRIQIYFGNLQEARSTRAAFRRDHPDTPCQLMPIDPNYAVTVGNYRDIWSARRALKEGAVGTWKHALVIPSDIDLPALR